MDKNRRLIRKDEMTYRSLEKMGLTTTSRNYPTKEETWDRALSI